MSDFPPSCSPAPLNLADCAGSALNCSGVDATADASIGERSDRAFLYALHRQAQPLTIRARGHHERAPCGGIVSRTPDSIIVGTFGRRLLRIPPVTASARLAGFDCAESAPSPSVVDMPAHEIGERRRRSLVGIWRTRSWRIPGARRTSRTDIPRPPIHVSLSGLARPGNQLATFSRHAAIHDRCGRP